MTKPPKPRWRKGPPNKPGYWVVLDFASDVFAWEVTFDRDDQDDGTLTPPYLRFTDGMTSEPIASYHAQWPVRRSFGPIPKPRKEKA